MTTPDASTAARADENSAFLHLNGAWDLYHTDDFPAHLVAETLPGRHAFAADVPESVQATLQRTGYLDDPRYGLNSLKARWVEETYWAYRRAFPTPDGYAADTPAWLVFERLELNAVVYLNGQEVGRHASAHRPARFDVTGRLRAAGEGENVLLVVIESGLFEVADKPGRDYRDSPQALLTKIHWQRRGQWQRGWDWQPRLLTVGITGGVRLEWMRDPFPTQTTVYAVPSDDLSAATVTVRMGVFNPTDAPRAARLEVTVTAPDGQTIVAEASVPVTLPSGESLQQARVTFPGPQLWWPVGHGDQPLYLVDASLCPDGAATCDGVLRRVGVRKVEVDQSAHPEEGRYFTLRVNDRPIFCKGGNWVPADMDPSSVTPERYRELVDLALGANFNLLRVWGGGVLVDESLLDYCDAKGVLIWHDLLFACSKYPGDDPAFTEEVRREVTWQMRETAHHPSLVVWCGNNEIEEGDWHWGWQQKHKIAPHYPLFHRDLPRIAAEEAPAAFYWISSPYSPDLKSPRDPTVGDQHPWKVSLQMAGGADWWEYRAMVDRYPNEGGVLGCSTPATLRDFLPERERHLLSATWEHHDNPFAINDTKPGELGHAYQTVRLWTGLDPLALDLETYAYVSGLLQAEGLTEYIANFRRRMFSSAAAIFWMYNDSWPATHGWTIVDWYRRKKLAYHPVRRAFAPVGVVCWREEGGDGVFFTVVNEGNEPWEGELVYGAFDTRGEPIPNDRVPVRVGPNSVHAYEADNRWDLFTGRGLTRTGAVAILYDAHGRTVAQHRAFWARFGELDLVRDPEIDLTLAGGTLTLRSDAFVWGVCLDTDGDAPVADNCFDLLPGVLYTLPWDAATLGEPRVARTGNGVLAARNGGTP